MNWTIFLYKNLHDADDEADELPEIIKRQVIK